MKLLGLSGYARTGKDTVAGILVSEFGFQKIGFADALRELVYKTNPTVKQLVDTYGWERAKDIRSGASAPVREALQHVGVTCREVLGENVWVDALTSKLRPDLRFVVPDMRFPNEFYAVENLGGETVRIERPGYGPVNGHVSETALDGFSFDHTLRNDGSLETLRYKAAELALYLEAYG